MDINTLIGYFIGVLGIIIAIISKRKKRIKIFATKQLSTISIIDDIKSDVSIYFEDTKVGNIDRFEIMIVNKGNVTIDGSEIISPIKFSVPKSSKILKYKILIQSKKHIDADIKSIDERNLHFSFTLLKPKDAVRILLLCSDIGEGSIEYSGRISGFPSFDKEQAMETYSLLRFS